MNLLVLALLAAATNTQPANNGGNAPTTKNTASKPSVKSKPSKPSTQTEAAPAKDSAENKSKPKKGEEAPTAPDAGSPASIVGNSVDAATQIANEAAKAAMEEIKRLQGIGGDAPAPSPATGKLVEAGVAGTAAAAKEVSKAKIEAALSGAVDVLWLVDKKGRTVAVPAAKIAYVEVGATTKGRVGFSS